MHIADTISHSILHIADNISHGMLRIADNISHGILNIADNISHGMLQIADRPELTVDLAGQTSLPLLIRCWTQTFAHTQRWTELHLVHFYLYYTQDSVYCKWQPTLTSCETVTENPFSCINATQCMSCPHKSCAQKHSGHNFIVRQCSYCLRFFYLTSPLYPTG